MPVLFQEPILFVDDDVNLILGISRQLRKSFNLDTAEGPMEALKLIDANPPYAVIISDMRMPEMNGIELLAEVQQRSPDSVRMMLTGNADLETAMKAVNESNIFRFLVKPAAKDALCQAIAAGIRQYRLVTAERELLESTLSNSVKVLTDILGLVNPAAFSRAARVKNYCQQLAELLELPERWQYPVAALLSQVGCVALPADTLAKIDAGDELSEDEQAMYAQHPALARELLEKIPRLDRIACWVGDQQRALSDYPQAAQDDPRASGHLGGMMLKAVIDLDTQLAGGIRMEKALVLMRKSSGEYHPDILAVLAKLNPVEVAMETRLVAVSRLNSSMVLMEDILTHGGLLLVKQGQEISPSMKARLENYAHRGEIEDQIRINVMKDVAAPESEELIPLSG